MIRDVAVIPAGTPFQELSASHKAAAEEAEPVDIKAL